MSIKQDGLRAFGAWELLAHRVRCGGDSGEHRVADIFDWQHSEQFIRGLAERGFNLYITHLSKGYGIEAEAQERQSTRRVVELCHKHGLYAGGYIRYSTIIPDAMRHEAPDCIERFAAVNVRGEFPRYGKAYWRYMPCPSSTDYLEYLDRIIAIGVSEIGLDCLHVDGLALRPEPYACHCERCTRGFRAWLDRRYPDEDSRRDRFGMGTDFTFVDPPDFAVFGAYTSPLPEVRDPLVQEWLLFRCHLLAQIWTFIVNAAHKRNPDCVVQGNSSFYPDSNGAWFAGLDIGQLAAAGSEGFFTEEGNAPNLTDDGRLHGYFETFKKLRGLGLLVFTYNREPVTHAPCTEPERIKRASAHQMAFNLDSAGVFCARSGPGQWPATVPEYMAFHRDRRDLFANTGQAHDVAIYYSERTRAFNAGTPIANSAILRDALMRAHVPFGYLLATRRKQTSDFRALVLPDVQCLSAEEADDIAEWVRAGGGALVIGSETGAFDRLRRRHRGNVLAKALDVEWSQDTPAFTVRVGQGRVAYLPRLVTPEGTAEELIAKRGPRPGGYFHLDSTQWRPARNAPDLVRMLRWAARDFRFEPVVPDTVVAEFAQQQAPERFLVHLVNFDLEHDVGPFEILCRGFAPSRAECLTPDGDAPAAEAIAAEQETPAAVRIEPGFHRYLIVAVYPQR